MAYKVKSDPVPGDKDAVDLPQLSPEPGKPSKIEVTSCNTTTPSICFYDKNNRRAFILLAEQGIRVGKSIIDNGLIVEESPDRSRATLMISAPGVRSCKPGFIGFSASPDRAIDWKAGDEITLRLMIFSFETSGIPGLLDTYPMLVAGDEMHLERVASAIGGLALASRYYQNPEFLEIATVEARVLKQTAAGAELSITNPTKHDASISIFAETSADVKKPLGFNGFQRWPKVEVKAGESRYFRVANEGGIESLNE